MKIVELSPDYSCPVLMDPIDQTPHNIEELPISEGLKEAIKSWDKQFQQTVSALEGGYSGFASMRELQDFNRMGNKLKTRLSNELNKLDPYKYMVSFRKLGEPTIG